VLPADPLRRGRVQEERDAAARGDLSDVTPAWAAPVALGVWLFASPTFALARIEVCAR